VPPRAVVGLPPGTDYLELLFRTRDAAIVRRELRWVVDEIEHRHPRFDTRLLRVLREVVEENPPDFLAWHFMIIAYVVDLPYMHERIKSATAWHNLEPIVHYWRDQFFIFSNAMHTFFEPANDANGKPRAYTDWRDFTLLMRYKFTQHYDMFGRWTATIQPQLPRPLAAVGIAADPRAWVVPVGHTKHPSS